ncbi:MAG: hypothetical protein NTW96_27055 [Planctomycetia bacterium]|nr:hypothetical protein [Planctomycetia bacterium]
MLLSTCLGVLVLAFSLGVARGETISVEMVLGDNNEFLVNLWHWLAPNAYASGITHAHGTVDVDLDVNRNPLTHQMTVLSVMAWGGSWSVDDLVFVYPITPLTVSIIGLQGSVWSTGASAVTNGTFPAADHGVTLNGGGYQDWYNGSPGSSWNFGWSPVSIPLTSGEGTLAVNLLSTAGTTDTYEVTGTLPVDITMNFLVASVSVTGVGSASGVFVFPEPEKLAGDANNDGYVDDTDASILGAHWMSTGAHWTDGDFNRDHVVSDADAAILAAHWTGPPTEDASVPEPTALTLLLGGLLSLLTARRRSV